MVFVGIYRALYDYHPQSSEELEIRDGDLLFVLDKDSDDDWWKCKKKAEDEEDDEPEGLVPNNYVEEAKVLYQATGLYEYSQQTDEELSFKEGETVQVYDTTDPDWTLAGLRGQYGFVPAIYIEKTTSSAFTSAAVPAPAPPPMPPRPAADEDEPLPGEADYPSPTSPAQSASGPAAALANILAQKTGSGSSDPAPTTQRALASPPLPSRNQQFTPEESEEDEAPPPKPARPPSQSIPSPPQVTSPVRSPKRSQSRYVPSGTAEAPGIMPDYDEPASSPRSPGGYHLYNISEMVSHMGKQKKLPMTLGINVLKGTVMISPEKSRDGPQQEWTAEKLTHYSIEGKHVFVELVRPSKSVDFHAGAKDTAQEIVAHLGELAGASRAEGLKEVLAASQGSQYAGMKKGKMLYEFMAQGEDEVTVAIDDEVIVLDDMRSEEWWMVRRLKNGKEGVVPSSYVEITGTIPQPTESYSGINAGKSTVEQNRLEEERLAKEAAKNSANARIPERQSSLTAEASSSRRQPSRRSGGKSKPNPSRIRTWTDRSGTFKVEAEFIGLREGKIHLHKLNGVKIAVPVTKMSVEDLEYVERATGASLDDDKPLSDIKRRSTQRAVNKAASSGAGATVVPKDHEYWFDFFLQCGVNPQICERYAQAFSRDQMGPEVLPEVNESLLRTLGLKEGDILRVMKFLDNKFDRQKTTVGAGGENGADGGLFSGPGGALKNNTRKGRPAPAVQTNDIVSEDAFKSLDEAASRSPTVGEGAQKTVLASAPPREPKGGFDDDAWAPKPSRTQTPDAAPKSAPPPDESKRVEDLVARPKVNDDIASLSITSPPLQPTVAPPPSTAPSSGILPVQSPPPSQQSQGPQGANKEIFDKIAALAPGRQRPQPPPQQQSQVGALNMPPPPRASSAPGFSPQNTAFGNVAPLTQQLTGYQPQQPQYGQQPGLQPQHTSFQYPVPSGVQQNGYPQQQQPQMPQITGIQAMQANYPALQPQPTGLNFQPTSRFGQESQAQAYGAPQGLQQQQAYNQALMNGNNSAASPFADPQRQPYQPGIGSGLANSFTAQPTGYQPQQQPGFNFSQPTGINGFQPQPPSQLPQIPNLPPQQTGGVFGPSQPLGLAAPAAPLIPQKTGPPPPVRFGVKPGEKKLVPQPTGRANLAKATPQNPFGF